MENSPLESIDLALEDIAGMATQARVEALDHIHDQLSTFLDSPTPR